MNEFVTWEALGSYAGAVMMVTLITQFLKGTPLRNWNSQPGSLQTLSWASGMYRHISSSSKAGRGDAATMASASVSGR